MLHDAMCGSSATVNTSKRLEDWSPLSSKPCEHMAWNFDLVPSLSSNTNTVWLSIPREGNIGYTCSRICGLGDYVDFDHGWTFGLDWDTRGFRIDDYKRERDNSIAKQLQSWNWYSMVLLEDFRGVCRSFHNVVLLEKHGLIIEHW